MSDIFDVGTWDPLFHSALFKVANLGILDAVGFLQTRTMQVMLEKHGSVAL